MRRTTIMLGAVLLLGACGDDGGPSAEECAERLAESIDPAAFEEYINDAPTFAEREDRLAELEAQRDALAECLPEDG